MNVFDEARYGYWTEMTGIINSKPPTCFLIKCAKMKWGNLLAGVEGLEPPASGFGDQRSSQLSYTPWDIRDYDNLSLR